MRKSMINKTEDDVEQQISKKTNQMNMSMKRSNVNPDGSNENAISLDDKTIHFFPNVKTLQLFNKNDKVLERENIEKYIIHYPIPLYNQPAYRKLGLEGDCPNAELAADNVISLPVHPSLTKEDLDLVIEAVKTASDKI